MTLSKWYFRIVIDVIHTFPHLFKFLLFRRWILLNNLILCSRNRSILLLLFFYFLLFNRSIKPFSRLHKPLNPLSCQFRATTVVVLCSRIKEWLFECADAGVIAFFDLTTILFVLAFIFSFEMILPDGLIEELLGSPPVRAVISLMMVVLE